MSLFSWIQRLLNRCQHVWWVDVRIGDARGLSHARHCTKCQMQEEKLIIQRTPLTEEEEAGRDQERFDHWRRSKP